MKISYKHTGMNCEIAADFDDVVSEVMPEKAKEIINVVGRALLAKFLVAFNLTIIEALAGNPTFGEALDKFLFELNNEMADSGLGGNEQGPPPGTTVH